MGMMSGFPMSSQGPKGGDAQFLQDAATIVAYFGKFKSGYYMSLGPDSGGTWKFEKYIDNPKGKWNELAGQVTEVYLVPKHLVLKGKQKLPRR